MHENAHVLWTELPQVKVTWRCSALEVVEVSAIILFYMFTMTSDIDISDIHFDVKCLCTKKSIIQIKCIIIIWSGY